MTERRMTGVDRRPSSGARRRHPAGPRAVAAASCCCAARVVVVGGALLALVARVAAASQALQFSPASIIAFRIAHLRACSPALVALWFVRPLRRRVTDAQVALYLEEHEPSLEAAILSAVDVGATAPAIAQRRAAASRRASWSSRRSSSAAPIDDGRGDRARRPMRRYARRARRARRRRPRCCSSLGPAFLRQGAVGAARRLARAPKRRARTRSTSRRATRRCRAAPIRRSRRSSPASASNDVALMVQAERRRDVRARAARRRRRRRRRSRACCSISRSRLEYFVEADGVRSPTFTMKVVDLPTVDNARARVPLPGLHRPARRRRSKTAATSRRCAAPKCACTITPTMATPGGQMHARTRRGVAARRRSRTARSPAASRSTRTASTASSSTGPHGEKVDGVAAVHDRRARRSARRRCRSTSRGATRTRARSRKCFVEARADDDFGVKQLELVYSVNGGAEKTVTLFGGRQAAARR